MDNPAMAHLIPSTLLSKKDVLFGNMYEIYQFHKRYSFFLQLVQEIKVYFSNAVDDFAHLCCETFQTYLYFLV